MNILDPKSTLPQDTGLRGYDLWLHIRKTIEADPDSWNQESWAGRDLPDSADYDLGTHRWTEATRTLVNDHGIEVVVPTCGTAYCVAGWAAELTGDPAALRVGSLNTDFTLSGLSISTAAEMALELDRDQSVELFASSNDLDRLDELAAWIWQGGPHPDKGEGCTCGTRECDGCYADDEYSDYDYVMDDDERIDA